MQKTSIHAIIVLHELKWLLHVLQLEKSTCIHLHVVIFALEIKNLI